MKKNTELGKNGTCSGGNACSLKKWRLLTNSYTYLFKDFDEQRP